MTLAQVTFYANQTLSPQLTQNNLGSRQDLVQYTNGASGQLQRSD